MRTVCADPVTTDASIPAARRTAWSRRTVKKCGEPYGEKNPNRHEYTQKYACDNATHVERCKCGVIIGAPEPHTWENGWCTECYYNCRHIGGTATCTEEAICENCGGAVRKCQGAYVRRMDQGCHGTLARMRRLR